MRPTDKPAAILRACLLTLCAFVHPALARQDAAESQPPDEVLRIETEIVQTGVTVFDKEGRFVGGLKKEDFELRVDGRPVPISFFETVEAGSHRDRVARAAGSGGTAEGRGPAPPASLRQRTIVFFLDDRHLSLDSVNRARRMLLDFVDKEMGEDDLIAVASSSGQIGFLQQFTDNREVLRAAAGRLLHVPYGVSDYARNPGSPMTEFMALTIERRSDPGVFDFYVQDCMKWAPRGATRQDRAGIRRHCEVEVENRARQILLQAGTVTAGTYHSLETLLRYAGKMPGSKLAFFISDGFLADTGPRGPTSGDRLARIADEARRAGVVIYTIDARGLVSGALDATGNVPVDVNGRLESANMREVAASQDALSALAADTGGRALRNQNYFDRFISDALAETSRFYLVAWRPEAEGEKNERLRKIEVSVAGRPELTVRAARALFGAGAAEAGGRASKSGKGAAGREEQPDADLRQALADSYPRHSLPLELSLIYLDTPASGIVLTSSVQAPTGPLSYGAQGTEPARLSVAGVVLDDQGKPAASFRTGLKVNPSPAGAGGRGASTVIYNHPSPLKPGVYQVRVAARDERSGILGSAMQWIVIPDLSARRLALSSLIVGLEGVADRSPQAGAVQWSVDRRFARGSRLRFMTFVYNAARAGGGAPDLSARVQVYRDGRAVVSTPLDKVAADAQADPARVPFTAEIGLGALQPGRYTLRVTVEDRAARQSASQQAAFYVQ
ncbi:MAG TPA: VWA domain-containing protein [Pyrinomonadaceae bacterium]|nr:VWA domain-containing protein [Pyrinomonadaceae bacterium]